jgi:hypothetical protein
MIGLCNFVVRSKYLLGLAGRLTCKQICMARNQFDRDECACVCVCVRVCVTTVSRN